MLIDSKKLQPGSKLAQDVVMPSGRTLMTTGMVLTQSMIDLIVKRNFDSIEIDKNSIKNNFLSDKVFTNDILINDTMVAFKKYIDSRDDYYSLVKGN